MPRFALDRARVMQRFAGIHEDLASAFGLAPEAITAKFHRIEHHTAHLASAFFVSPFDQAAVLSADGLGDFASSMWALGQGSHMDALGEVTFPHLARHVLHRAHPNTSASGNSATEYKVMGMAAYGQPEFIDEFRRIVRADAPLSFKLGLEYFVHQDQGADMTWRDANKTPVIGRLFSPYLEQRLGPARAADAPLEQRHYNMAASMQGRDRRSPRRALARARRKDETEESMPGRRRRFQLRCERHNLRQNTFRKGLRTARRR